ncbi:metallophosphoesterase [Pelagicoccus sp. SDUM812005]|uniref:metallophosphoesterase family protein n=1 Tax=Pelagicoccus sp. SDUM812005 TaxID=3041257 RepID=UPI00280D9AEB|nr:metallophosphoesterase [Pelagicoccus sp. SDUM812005]MDQ8180389.1 metallophosphoesterase [Pelagicoccus sp. SDUM812005]
MKIQVISDLHLERDSTPFRFIDAGTELVVLAGDIHSLTLGVDWAVSAIPNKPVLYVLGNHEYYGGSFPRLIDECRAKAEGTNVTVLERDIVEYGGFRFFGATLWTDFSLYGNPGLHSRIARVAMNDYRLIRNNTTGRGLDPRDTKHCHSETLVNLIEFLESGDLSRSIVITHHLPTYCSVHQDYQGNPLSAAFASRLDSLIESEGPSVWIHGHNHQGLDYLIDRTRIFANQKGYSGEIPKGLEFDPTATIDLEAERIRYAKQTKKL